MNPEVKRYYDQALARFVLAGASEAQHDAALRMMRWMYDAEDKEEFILYMNGLDAIEVFSVKFIKLLIQLHPTDNLLRKAIELKVIRRKI